jgi:MFS family permease
LVNLKPGGDLWRHRDFLHLWFSETVSQFGSTFSGLAIPFLAVLAFKVTPFELGLLPTLAFLPYPTLGLFVGVLVDRSRRRRIMIACNLGRMVALGSIPVAAFLGCMTLIQLYAVSMTNGVFSVFFDVAYQSYLPALVDRGDLVEGNQKLQMSASGASVAGPGLAGVVYQSLGGAVTVAFDAIGYLISAISLGTIRKKEVKPQRGQGDSRPNFLAEMKEGIKVVSGNPVLWTLAGCTATSNLGSNIAAPMTTYFALNTLLLSPALLGFVGTVGAIGFLLGVLLSGRFTKRLGLGMSLAVAISGGALAALAPLALYGYPFLVLSSIAFITGFMVGPYNINAVSLRQVITPDRLQGRMNATTRAIIWGTIPIGSFVGGVLGETIGVVDTVILGGIAAGIASVWILLGPVIKLKTQPAPVML